MFQKKPAVLPVFLLLVGTLATSGCVQLGGEEQPAKYGNGVMITSFEAVPGTVFAGDDYDLILDVQNKGGRTAKDVNAYFYSVAQGEFKNKKVTLDPPTKEIAGQRHTFSWSPDSPTLPQGITRTLNPKVRVFYKYQTIGAARLPVISKSEYKRRVKRDRKLPQKEPVTVSRGPFSIQIKGESPARVEDTQGERTFRIYIVAKNLLDGTPYYRGAHPSSSQNLPRGDSLDTVEMEININSTNAELTSTCDQYTSFNNITIRRGEVIRESCEVNVSTVEPVQEIPIMVRLRYGYFLSSETSVKVRGESQ